jgi:ubiquinone/menaquinone biosynthesis C-methylase UbiE
VTDTATFDNLAAPYDRGMRPLERLFLRTMRRRLLARATGRILELGIGTGANLPFYGREAIRCLTAVDESAEMLAVAAGKTRALGHCTLLCQADVEALPFPAGRFDTVVASLVFCSVVDVSRGLAEVRRVLSGPSGRVLLLEHMRPRVQPLALVADVLDVPWYAFNGRCHLNRRTEDALGAAGLRVDHVASRVGGLFRLIVARGGA